MEHTTIPVSTLPEGTHLSRFLLTLAASGGNTSNALAYGERFARQSPHVLKAFDMMGLEHKAAVLPGMTSTPAWAGVLNKTGLADEALQLLRGLSIVAQLSPKMQQVPFGQRTVVDATAVPLGGWIGENVPMPIGTLTFAPVGPLLPTKVGSAVVVTRELVTVGGPTVEKSIRTTLLSQLAAVIDKLFLDPTVAPAGGAPGSITNGGIAITSSGATPAAITADLAAMIAAITTTGKGLTWIMRPTTAAHVAAALGAASNLPGTLYGLPVALSANSPQQIVLADLAAVLYADEGQFDVELTGDAAVMMDSAPVPGTTPFTSLWQNNLIGMKPLRWLNWARAASGSVVYMTVTYLGHAMSDDSLIDAIETYKLTPEQLTDAQLAVIAKADPALGQQARARRRSARDAEMRESCVSLGLDSQRLKGLSVSEGLAEVVGAAIKQAEKESAKRIAALETRLLELEFTQAVKQELLP